MSSSVHADARNIFQRRFGDKARLALSLAAQR
jgi:hypothetical protein